MTESLPNYDNCKLDTPPEFLYDGEEIAVCAECGESCNLSEIQEKGTCNTCWQLEKLERKKNNSIDATCYDIACLLGAAAIGFSIRVLTEGTL